MDNQKTLMNVSVTVVPRSIKQEEFDNIFQELNKNLIHIFSGTTLDKETIEEVKNYTEQFLINKLQNKNGKTED